MYVGTRPFDNWQPQKNLLPKKRVDFSILKFFHVKSWGFVLPSGDHVPLQLQLARLKNMGASFVSRHSTSGFISRQVGMRVLFGGCCAHSPRDDGDGLMWFLWWLESTVSLSRVFGGLWFQFFFPRKLRLTMGHPPWMKMYFPIKNGGIFQCHVSFQGCSIC